MFEGLKIDTSVDAHSGEVKAGCKTKGIFANYQCRKRQCNTKQPTYHMQVVQMDIG